jgi:hypothetical protein
MKKTSPFLYSAQFSFIDLFSDERITIQDNLLSKINNDFSCKHLADLCDATLPTKTFTQHKLTDLWGTVNNKKPLHEKGNFSQPIYSKPIQVFAVKDITCGLFLPFTFTSYKTMGTFNNLICSYLN